MINVWTKYSEPKLYGNGETDLITKNLTLFFNAVTVGKAIPMSGLQRILLQVRQK